MTETIALSPLDQVMPRVYIEIYTYFQLPAEKRSAALDHLRKGLDTLTEVNPIFAAHVCPHPSRKGWKEGVVYTPKKIPFREATHKEITYQQLETAHFQLTTDQIRSCSACGYVEVDDSEGKTWPAMKVQANLVEDGLVLSFAFFHTTFDGSASGTTVKLLSDLCAGVDPGSRLLEAQLPPFHVKHAMPLDRAVEIHGPLWKPGNESACLPPRTIEKLYRFSSTALKELKGHVGSGLKPQHNCDWISTNDAIVAFIWHCVSRIRTSHLQDQLGETYSLYVPLNARSRLRPPLQSGYIGTCTMSGAAQKHRSNLTMETSDLAATAASIRASITGIDDAFIRAQVALVDAEPDITPAVIPHLGLDSFVVTSYAKNTIKDTDFGGVLGQPKEIRILSCPGEGSYCRLQTMGSEGDLKFYLTMEPATLADLDRDEDWRRFVEVY